MKTVSAKISVALLVMVMTLAVMPLSAFALSQQQQEDIYRVDTLWQEEYPAKYIDFLLTSDNFVYHLDVTEGDILKDFTYASVDLNAYQKKANYREILISIIEYTHDATNDLSKQEIAQEVKEEFTQSLEKHLIDTLSDDYNMLQKAIEYLNQFSAEWLSTVYLPNNDVTQLSYSEICNLIYAQIGVNDPGLLSRVKSSLDTFDATDKWLKNTAHFQASLDLLNMGMDISSDYLDGVVELEALMRTNEKYADLLCYLYNTTEDKALKAACYEIYEQLETGYRDNLVRIFNEALAQNAMEHLGLGTVKSILTDASLSAKIVVFFCDAGMFMGKWLFNVDDLAALSQTVFCLNELSERLVVLVREDLAQGEIYGTPSTKAAEYAANTIYHVKTLIELRKMGEATYYALKDTAYSSIIGNFIKNVALWDDYNFQTVEDWYRELGRAMNIVQSSLFQIIPLHYYYAPDALPEFTVEDGTLLRYNSTGKNVYIGINIRTIAGGAFAGAATVENVEIFEYTDLIEAGAFSGCTNLKTVTLHNPYVVIEPGAFPSKGENLTICGWPESSAEDYALTNGHNFIPFEHHYDLPEAPTHPDFRIENGILYGYYGYDADVYIPYGVTEIADEAFYGRSISSVTVPETVTKIGNSAFAQCGYLTEVYLPDSLRKLGDYAFMGCDSLEAENLRLPSGLTEVGLNPFLGTPAHLEYLASADNCFYLSHYLLESRDGQAQGQTLTVRDGTRLIANGALANLQSFSSISLPEGLLYIGNSAFDYSSFVSINIPNSVLDLGQFAFFHCTALKSIRLSDSMTALADETFSGCYSLESVNLGKGITQIGGYAFRDCYSFTTLTLSNQILELWDNFTFEGIKCLVYLDGVKTVTEAMTSSLGVCYLEEVRLPDSVETIGERAFYSQYYLSSVKFSQNLKTIGKQAFYYCENLASVSFPQGLESIGEEAFYQCFSLRELNIPGTVTSIGDSAFIYCENVTALTLAQGVTSIGASAFTCTGITELYLPSSVTSIGEYAFSFCEKLHTLIYNAAEDELDLGVFYHCIALENVTLTNTVKSIEEFAFTICENIKNVHFIGTCSEWDSIDFHYENQYLKEAPSITFESHIGEWEPLTPPVCTAPGTEQLLCTFCGHLSTRETAEWHLWDSEWTVDLPASCTENGSRSRHCVNCDEKTDITPIPAAHTFSDQWTVDLPATCTAEGSQSRHCEYCDEKTDVTPIPAAHRFSAEWTVDLSPTETAEGQKSRHCLLCDEKTDITPIPKLLTPAPAEDFDYFETDGKIEIYGYRGTATELLIPSIIEGKPVTKISGFTFSGNATIKVLVIPDSVVELESYALYNCTALEKVTLGKGITQVADSLFSECGQLREVIFEGAITSLGEWVFFQCVSLESITLTNALTEIKSYAFWGCSAFTDVYFYGSEAQWQQVNISNTGNNILRSATVHLIAHTHAYTTIATHNGQQHKLLCSCGDYVLEAHLWLFFGCEQPRECQLCGEKEATAPGHTFKAYISNGDATYTADGTKTATCEYCSATHTVIDTGSALGLPQQFKDEMSDFTQNDPATAGYSDLYALLVLYSALSPEEKEAVEEEYQALRQAIEQYNEKVDVINGETQTANQLAFFTPVGTAATLLAGLWLWLLKKIIL